DGTVITMDNERNVIHNGCIAIEKGVILEVGDRNEISGKYKAKKTILQ
ncbi:unnamed protein product, partial [marine sediment metagenome]